MKSCICIVAWHYYPELFETLAGQQYLDLFVVSHRSQSVIPGWIYQYIPSERVLIQSNLGYDWGAYDQFLRTGVYRGYDFVFFTHDDIRILDPQVFKISAEIIAARGGRCVLGNGRQSDHREWVRTHPQSYAHSHWKPPSWGFCHDVVRGSFFATSTAALEQIGGFEVLWDRRGYLGVGAGNWSLRATCGKMQARLGDGCFHFLSGTYLSSPYISEMERGRFIYQPKSQSSAWLIRNKLLVIVSRRLMSLYLNTQSVQARQKYARWMRKLFDQL